VEDVDDLDWVIFCSLEVVASGWRAFRHLEAKRLARIAVSAVIGVSQVVRLPLQLCRRWMVIDGE
jgi:hypothetical protein